MKKFAKILAAAVLFGTAAGTAFQGAEMPAIRRLLPVFFQTEMLPE